MRFLTQNYDILKFEKKKKYTKLHFIINQAVLDINITGLAFDIMNRWRYDKNFFQIGVFIHFYESIKKTS